MISPLFFNSDIGAVLRFTIVDAENAPYDLTGGVVTLLVEGLGSFPCAIDSATAGQCSKTVAANEFAPGRYRSQVRVVIGSVTLHTVVFVINVGEVVTYDPPAPVPPPANNPSEGAIPFGATGGGSYSEDPLKLAYDNAKNYLVLNGATVGSAADGGLAIKNGTGPTSRPADVVQVYADDVGGAGSSGLVVLSEGSANPIKIGADVSGLGGDPAVKVAAGNLVLYAPAGTSIVDGAEVQLRAGGTEGVRVDASRNLRIASTTAGTSATNTLAIPTGVAPTTSPANTAQLYVADVQTLADRAAFHIRSEDGFIRPLGVALFRQVGSALTNVNNTATETTILGSAITVKGGTLSGKNGLRILVFGDCTQNNGANGWTVRFKYGGTTFATLVSTNITASANLRSFVLEAFLYPKNNATGTQTGYGFAKYSPADNLGGAGSDAAPIQRMSAHIAVAVDATADQALDITVQHTAASAAQVFRTYTVLVESLG